MPSDISNPADKIEVLSGAINSPEIYFGSARNSFLGNGERWTVGTQDLTAPSDIKANTLYLGGSWSFDSEYAENKNAGTVIFKYSAKNVYMVASSDKETEVEVYLDGKLKKTISVKAEMLYSLISGTDYGGHTLMLKIKNPGVDIFTFTFG